MIVLGLGELRLAPNAFWRMTPRELVALSRAREGAGTSPLSRAELHDLMTIYPDKDPEHG